MSKPKRNIKKEQVKESEKEPFVMIKKLENSIKARSELMCFKEIKSVIEDDRDLLKYPKPNVKETHNKILKNHREVSELVQNVRKERNSSENKMDFCIDEINDEDDVELYEAMVGVRQQSEKLFKNLISTQVSFNECLIDDLLIDTEEKKDHIKNHMNLIEQLCKYESGIESLFSCHKNLLKEKMYDVEKIKTVSQFKKVCNELAEGKLNECFKSNMRLYKNHPHLLAAQQYSKSTEEMLPKIIQTGTIDPFTKQLITKPIKNKCCQHVYDQSSIELMFQQRLFISCPYIGCTNNRFTRQDLLFDQS